MYLHHWNLNLYPFENAPSPVFFYPSQMHLEALERIRYCVEQGKGAAMISGDVGCGKTTISQVLMTSLESSRCQIVTITNPALDSISFIEAVMDSFKAPCEQGCSKAKMWKALEYRLSKNLIEGTESVLIIDEAQVINSQKTLEELRMLLNLQAKDRYLICIILLGQLELERKIKQIRSLDERISIRYRLLPLPFIDAIKYIKHRLCVAGCIKIPFTKEAFYTIFHHARGIPRRINNLCDRSLLVAYLADKKIVSKTIVVKAWEDLRCSSHTFDWMNDSE